MVDRARIVPVVPTFLRLLYITIVSRGVRVALNLQSFSNLFQPKRNMKNGVGEPVCELQAHTAKIKGVSMRL